MTQRGVQKGTAKKTIWTNERTKFERKLPLEAKFIIIVCRGNLLSVKRQLCNLHWTERNIICVFIAPQSILFRRLAVANYCYYEIIHFRWNDLEQRTMQTSFEGYTESPLQSATLYESILFKIDAKRYVIAHRLPMKMTATFTFNWWNESWFRFVNFQNEFTKLGTMNFDPLVDRKRVGLLTLSAVRFGEMNRHSNWNTKR